jgi:cobalt-zinc-cadmium efflux system outer membrane protein
MRELAASRHEASLVRLPDEPVADVPAAFADGRLTRAECAEIVLGSHPRLEAAFHEIGVARAGLARAGLLANPSLSVFFLFPEGGGRTELQGTIAASLADLWRIPTRERAAQSELDARVLDAARLAGELVTSACDAYDHAVATEEAAHIAERTSDLARRRAELLQGLADRGAGRGLDARLASAAASSTAIERSATRAEADAARAELLRRLALGGARREFVLADDLRDAAEIAGRTDELVRLALAERLDVRALDARIEALARRVPVARRDVLLQADVAVHAERNPEGRTLLGPGLDVPVPLFDRGDAAASAAEFELLAERARRAAWIAEIEQDVRAAVARAAAASDGTRTTREALLFDAAAASTEARAARLRGDVDATATFAAEEVELRATSAVLAARIRSARAVADLERAVGLPWSRIAAVPRDGPQE